MFFLLRCFFWLGLVYLAMARDAGAFHIDFGGAQRAVEAAASVAPTGDKIEKVCAQAPRLCAEALKRLKGAASSAAGAASSSQSLTAADFSEPWRGPALRRGG